MTTALTKRLSAIIVVLLTTTQAGGVLNLQTPAFLDASSLTCLGVLADDAGDVSYPETGVFGTCLARADMRWPDSDDTIVSIVVTGEFDIHVKVLATQI